MRLRHIGLVTVEVDIVPDQAAQGKNLDREEIGGRDTLPVRIELPTIDPAGKQRQKELQRLNVAKHRCRYIAVLFL